MAVTEIRPCTKMAYQDEQRARTMLNKARKRRFLLNQPPEMWEKNVYLCKFCELWHLTSISEGEYIARNTPPALPKRQRKKQRKKTQ